MDTLVWNPSLLRELADHDARRLMDIGVVRAEDGSLRLATDPAVPAVPFVAPAASAGFAAPIRALFREIRDALASTSANGPAAIHS
jgi:hypothetical protein